MKTVFIEKPGEIAVIETPMIKANPGEALLKIKYCGICGADVASYTGNQPFTTYPRIPGHEFSAEIAELPEGYAGDLKVGDIVTANPYFNCGTCYSCRRGHVNCCTGNQTMGVQRDGSFTEYVSMPIERIYDGMGLDAKTLAMIEPFSIGWHALSRAEVKPGDKVLVVGAGPIGLFALISAKILGAEVYSCDILDGRLEMAKKFGAVDTFNTTRMSFTDIKNAATNGDGFDVTVEACGQPVTFLGAIEAAAFASNLILIGNGKKETSFIHSIILQKELNVYGSRNSLPEDFRSLIKNIAEGKVELGKMVSAVYPMEKADEAFKALVANDGSLSKVLVEIG